jgi:NDP-sugar pyrophosphorylase family protein
VLPTLLLTAGLGTRLDPLSRLIAKPAVPLAGSTLVERVLGGLRAQGLTDVVLNLHHRPETITGLLGDGAHLGLRIRYSWEQPILGSAGGPRRALPLLGGDRILIVNGDTLSAVSITALLAFHERMGAAATMAVVPNPAPHHYNGVKIDAAGRVVGFVRKGPEAVGTHHFIGVQIVETAILAPLPVGQPCETVWGVYKDLVERAPGRVCAMPVDTPFDDVGTPADYLAAALRLGALDGGASTIEAPAGAIAPSARITRSVVWRDVEIDADVTLEDTIVAGRVHLPRGFTATKSVIVPASVLTPQDTRAKRAGTVAVFPL